MITPLAWFSSGKALQTAFKLKRGLEDTSKPGAFTKELVYFSGYLQVENFVSIGGDLRDLYFGKFNLRDLELIKKIPGSINPRFFLSFSLKETSICFPLGTIFYLLNRFAMFYDYKGHIIQLYLSFHESSHIYGDLFENTLRTCIRFAMSF